MNGTYILQLEAKDIMDNTLEIKNKKRYSASFDYSLDFIQLQKLNNTVFYYDNDKLYSNAIISVKFTYSSDDYTTKQLRHKLYTDGFNLLINGQTIHYVRYKRSAGSARLGKVLFIEEKYYDEMMKWSLCGIDIKNRKLDLASLESYVALSLSSIENTIKIKPNEILLINDYESTFTDYCIVSKEQNGQLTTSEEKTEITNSIWDGQSLLDSSKFTGPYKNKSMLLLRNRFFKSNCLNTNITLYMKERFKKDYNNAVIKDMYGNDIRVKDIKLITTPNSIKYLKFEDYNYWLNNLTYFGIVKTDTPSHEENGTMTRLNYQIVNTLDLHEQDIEKLLEQEFHYFDLLKNDLFAIRHYLKIKQASMYEIDSTDDFIYSMLSINNNISNTEIFAKYKRKIIDSFARRLKECRILVNGTHATIFGNVYEMLTSATGDFKQILFNNEIYAPMFTEKQIIMFRNPHITMGNVVIANNTNNDLLKKYFNINNEIVIINSINNNILQQLNGCDFDGDSVIITDNELLIDKSLTNMKIPTTLVKSVKILEEYTLTNLANLDIRTSKNYIGEIVNLSQYLNTLFWHNRRNGLPTNEIYKSICILCSLSNVEIDKAKRETNINTRKELQKIRDKYNITKIRPYYFKVFTSGYDYRKMNSPTDILLDIVEKKSKKRSKRISKKATFTSLFKNANINMNNIDYDKIKLIITIIYNFTKETKQIYSSTTKDKQEKYVLYIQEKEKCMSLIKNIPITTDEIKYIINIYDKAQTEKNKNEEEKILIDIRRKLFTILYNYNKKQFMNVFKETKEEIEILIPDDNGIITIYNTNYSIKKI